ncbi:sugar transferase [Rhodospirillum rubrum]|uniref:exopolysaccharide biosynthesis polyprenyl glycosylphosphotransferase n=1 Tax=Rhodospirillum rubrum TaxID=1085 RepID=UPI001ECBCFCD|nr:exopolysaccharide biosynthesis polyprenyl glycosylphosphotransferase [Rhodospirillum rubrum]MBK1663485.1 sugar transferase [Rhodospirillum rubrum]MBK1675683.1 sugar transferase [Rhodospirillum rubrum]
MASAETSLHALADKHGAKRPPSPFRLPRPMRVALVGAGLPAAALIEFLQSDDARDDYTVVAIFDERGDRRPPVLGAKPVEKGLSGLRDLAEAGKIDAILLTLYGASSARMFEIIERIGTTAVDIYLPREHKDKHFSWTSYHLIGGLPFLCIKGRPFRGFAGVFKRIEDYTLAVLALTLIGPILLLAMLAIRLDSPGPALIHQRRIGLGGKLFSMLKLRSMHFDPDDDGRIGAIADDPRITRVGAFLRATSIDELPQVLNVLRGDMSMIGPRPHVPNMLVENTVYGVSVGEYVARHRVRPGITGWAQVNGMRGGIHDIEKARRGAQLDIYYIENWTPWLDIKILWRTIFGGLRDPSALRSPG